MSALRFIEALEFSGLSGVCRLCAHTKPATARVLLLGRPNRSFVGFRFRVFIQRFGIPQDLSYAEPILGKEKLGQGRGMLSCSLPRAWGVSSGEKLGLTTPVTEICARRLRFRSAKP